MILDNLRQIALRMFSGLVRGLLAVAAIIAIIVLAAIIISLIRTFLASRARSRELAVKRALATAPDGAAAPPYGPGLCQRCGRAEDIVYFFPDGSRLCNRCYRNPAATTSSPGARKP